MNDHILKWGPFIDIAIRKWAKKCPKDRREDLKHDCYVQLMVPKPKLALSLQKAEREGFKDSYMAAIARNLVCGTYRLAPEEHVEWVPLEEVDRHKKVELDIEFISMMSVLTPVEQSVITLFYRDRASKADIADHYGRSPKWASNTLRRAVTKLRVKAGDDAGNIKKNLA